MGYRKLFYKVIMLFLVFILPSIMGEGFVAGTLVKTPQGYSAIENLNIGDQLFCCDGSGELAVSTITASKKNISSQLITITTNTI